MSMYKIQANIIVAINHLGGQTSLSTLLGISQPAVHKWYNGKSIPKRVYVEQISALLSVHARDLEFGDLASILDARDRRPPELIEEWINVHDSTQSVYLEWSLPGNRTRRAALVFEGFWSTLTPTLEDLDRGREADMNAARQVARASLQRYMVKQGWVDD